ncbi:PLP-dependent transferase [Rhizodiscina lignyota]|uniref:PLP-dependent transferase n=1 Tax=Rhizodiscina lignyota TaxID=1504668 RepID=A0A9P4IEA9_9PEZI|nr:PLP-dependent transferase [Rhizodiscina lignyota]
MPRERKKRGPLYDEHDASAPNRPLGPAETPFYGLLDEEEQEYFKRADDLLELNQFEGPEERGVFLANVYREAEGKELRLANSQSSSRLLERLILLSSPGQLKGLFQKFSGHFLHLVQHRFASHCCEALFIQSAPLVSQELTSGGPIIQDNGDPNQVVESMENLFLHTINELEGYVGYLMTDKFASHTLRVLLVVLSGQSLTPTSRKKVQSKKKEHISVNGIDTHQELILEQRVVPDSFYTALEKLINECVSGLETTYLRALATHQVGNPVLQLLLQMELSHFGKQRAKDETSLIRKLLPDDPITAESESATFINGLIYDPIGSRLLEAIVEHAPGKLFKNLYRQFFKERLPTLARNEIASYVVCKIVERLGKDDLQEAVDAMIPQISNLVEKNRTAPVKTLIERCGVRGIETSPLASAIGAAYTGPNGFDIARLLRLADSRHASEASGVGPPSPTTASSKSIPTPQSASEKVHSSLLAQTMLTIPGSLSELIFTGMLRLPPTLSLKAAHDPSSSRVIQAALTSPFATVIFRRKLIQNFYGQIGAMALDPSASRVIDAIWNGTGGLAFIRERIAEELAENEASLRESGVGRHVWRRWEMDLWRRRRGEWVAKCRESAGSEGFIGFPEDGFGVGSPAPASSAAKAGRAGEVVGGKKKTPIELAREKHAAQKARDAKDKENKEKKKRRENEIIPFIRAADNDAESKSSGHGLAIAGNAPRTALVEYHPPQKLQNILRDELELPEYGVGKVGLLRTVRSVLQYSVNTWDQGFMDKLYASTNAVGLLSELLLAVLNTNVHVFTVSPVLTLVEKSTTRHLASLFGFTGPHAGGISQPGGSASNQSSIVIARNVMFPETKDEGNGDRRFVLFTSAHGHYSVEKAAQMFGFGSRAVVAVEVDEHGRMRAEKLDEAIEKAKSEGKTPFYVNATAGTTVMGSFDPFDDIADVCEKHGLWMHVDGSWGGPVVFSQRLAFEEGRLKGVQRADSIAVTPHKMLGVPLTCSFLLGKDMRQFWRAMTLPAGYLFHNTNNEPSFDDIYDLADLTPQCGRKGESLKMFLGWTYYGARYYRDMIEGAFDRANYLHDLLEKHGNFVIVSRRLLPCLQVCFYWAKDGKLGLEKEHNGNLTAKIVGRLVPKGWLIDYAPGENGKFFRVVVSGQTKRGTVEGLVKAIDEIGLELERS